MLKNIYRICIFETFFENKNLENIFLTYLKKFKEENKLNIASNSGGVQTYAIDGSKFNESFKYPINEYLLNFKRKIDFSWTINGLWINQNFKYDYNRPHNHVAEYNKYCGIWYLKTPLNSGNLIFFNKSSNSDCTLTYDFIDDISVHSNYTITPKKNMLILFPSHLVHMVEPNKSNEDRISVAFNINFNKV